MDLAARFVYLKRISIGRQAVRNDLHLDQASRRDHIDGGLSLGIRLHLKIPIVLSLSQRPEDHRGVHNRLSRSLLRHINLDVRGCRWSLVLASVATRRVVLSGEMNT